MRIVVIGGGTGLSTMLRGLKDYSANITAIVTVIIGARAAASSTRAATRLSSSTAARTAAARTIPALSH